MEMPPVALIAATVDDVPPLDVSTTVLWVDGASALVAGVVTLAPPSAALVPPSADSVLASAVVPPLAFGDATEA